MPIDFGASDLLVHEYERFLEGLHGLSDGGQARARAAAARRRPGDVSVRSVSIPSWDDVFHVVPHPQVDPMAREAHYAALRAGKPSPLDPQLVDELERRGRRARLMSSSASPAYAQNFGQLMTAIDNVQDLLTTVVTVGRLVLNPTVRVMDRLAPTFGRGAIELAEVLADKGVLSEAALLAERRIGLGLGARTIGRFIPILGPILLAADLLKLVTILGMLAFPAYSVWCAGVAGLPAAALPALLYGRSLKLRASSLANMNPFAHKAFLSRANLLRSWKPSIYNLMEVAQTTDALFGVGVSFGGLVGLVQDSAFGLQQRAMGQDVRVTAQPWAESAHRVLSGKLATETAESLDRLRVSAGVLVGGLLFNRTQEDFTVEEHRDALVAQSVAWSHLRPWIEAPEMVSLVNLILDQPCAVPSYRGEQMLAALAAEGIPDAPLGRWPFPGSPVYVTGEQLMQDGAATIPGALERLLAPLRDEPIGMLLGAVARRITDRAALLMTGSADGYRFELQPVWQVIESLCLAARLPNTSAGEDVLLAYVTECATWLHDHRAKQLPQDVLDALALAVGQPMLKLLPPDAPIPEDVLRQFR